MRQSSRPRRPTRPCSPRRDRDGHAHRCRCRRRRGSAAPAALRRWRCRRPPAQPRRGPAAGQARRRPPPGRTPRRRPRPAWSPGRSPRRRRSLNGERGGWRQPRSWGSSSVPRESHDHDLGVLKPASRASGDDAVFVPRYRGSRSARRPLDGRTRSRRNGNWPEVRSAAAGCPWISGAVLNVSGGAVRGMKNMGLSGTAARSGPTRSVPGCAR